VLVNVQVMCSPMPAVSTPRWLPPAADGRCSGNVGGGT